VIVRALVTGACGQGALPVELCMAIAADEVRVTVRMGTLGRPRRQLAEVEEVEEEAAIGQGLVTVDSLADGWGVSRSANGTTVWFVINAGR
jgi:hypothetical protein